MSKKFTPVDPLPAELKKVDAEAPLALSAAIKDLLDDDREGGIFYAHIIQQMCRSFGDPRVPTAAVSVTDKINLYINPWFWCKTLTTPKQRAAVLKHEVLHLIFDHCFRCMDFGDRELANIAADLVVNSQINTAIFGDMAKQFLFPSKFKLPNDETLDYYYKNFPVSESPICKCSGCSDCKPSSSASGSAPGNTESCGDGEGKCSHCGGYKSFDFHGLWNETEGKDISEAMKSSLIKDAIIRASETVQHTGNLPVAIRNIISLAKEKPQIPWQLILRQFISKVSGGALSHTIKRISKRFKMRPGPKITPRLKLLVAVDVSGSVIDQYYQLFFNEIISIARYVGKIDVLEFDAAICSIYPLTAATPKVTRSGNGGNDLRPVIEWVRKNQSKYDGIIWFTDGEFCGYPPPARLGIPSLWILTPDGTDRDLQTYRCIKLPSLKAPQ